MQTPVVRLSANIGSHKALLDEGEVQTVLPPAAPAIYAIEVEEPRRDVIRTEVQLREFARLYRDLLFKIRATHGPRDTDLLAPPPPGRRSRAYRSFGGFNPRGGSL